MEYIERLIDAELRRALAAFPAIMVVGPRACGKTTSAARLAAQTVHLDRPAQANVFRADVDVALSARTEPVLLDEWQDVPEVRPDPRLDQQPAQADDARAEAIRR